MLKFAARLVEEKAIATASAEVFRVISDDLARVDLEFARQASSNIQVIDYLGEYLRSSGGKRVRPALLILAVKTVGGPVSESVIRMATVMEMLHTATLVHDDIIDNADLRRSRPTINARFGNQTAVLMGDWLYMSAFETTVAERSLEILDLLTRVTRKMTEGELMQLTAIGRLDLTEDVQLDLLKRKTAYLFSACCEVGAILGGAGDREQKAIAAFGMNLGMAFQLSDDMLDLTSDAERLGKQAGSDLLEGKITLPYIRLVQQEPHFAEVLEDIMLSGTYDRMSREELVREMERRNILDDVRGVARGFAERAIKNLEVLPASEYRSSLEKVLSFVIERNS
jgi:octaprenyl-diphosphate synthase